MNTTSKVAQTTANWILKDTNRSNLNSKVKYPSLALSLTILFLLLVYLLASILLKYDLVLRT